MFTDRQTAGYWITRLRMCGRVQVPWDLDNCPSRPESPTTQAYSGLIGDDLTLSKVIFTYL